MSILWFLDFLSEFIQLTYELGVNTRKVVIPALVFTYVCGEYVWNYVTPVVSYYVNHTPYELEWRSVS